MLSNVIRLFTREEAPLASALHYDAALLDALEIGARITFAATAPRPLNNKTLRVTAMVTYCFEQAVVESFRLAGEDGLAVQLMVGRDAQGHYLALSRQIDASELHALMQQESKPLDAPETFRLKDALLKESAWFATSYRTAMKHVPGTLHAGRIAAGQPLPPGKKLHYTLYTSEEGNCALEIEHYRDGRFQVLSSIYRGAEDIAEIRLPTDEERATWHDTRGGAALSLVPSLADDAETLAEWLDEPQDVAVQLPVMTAFAVMNDALCSNQRISDVLRGAIGLELMSREEVALQLQLSEADYKQLAMRYQLKASNKEEIHRRVVADIHDHFRHR